MKLRKYNHTNQEILELILQVETSQRALAGVFNRKFQQIWRAIHTDKYPTLRNKIIAYLINRKNNSQNKK